MKCPKTTSEAIKYFRKFGNISVTFLMYKFKIGYDHAEEIRAYIEKRFPNLWRDRHANFMNKRKV